MMPAALETPSGGNRPRYWRLYRARPLGRECGGYNTPRGERSPRLLRRFELPAPAPLAGTASKADQEPEIKNSPYLDKLFIPLAVALRSMLAETEAKLATAAPAEKARLQEKAEVLREWIKPKSAIPLST